jgi:uncharacterized protein (DUF1800 family)
MPGTNTSHNLHLLWRAGFGPAVTDIPLLDTSNRNDLFSRMLKSSSRVPEYINVAGNEMQGLFKGIQEEGKMQQLTKEQKQEIRKQSREDLKNLNLRWLEEMVNGNAALREKLSFFWHGHFACREINIFYQQQLLDIIRKNALGNFGDLLRKVSRSASMLSFLNNQQNRKQSPNENFAREVMELFTMGRGNYSEKDIKEAARAFTGWGFNLAGEFVFRRNFHDAGEKTFMGRTGNFDGDDILDMLLENPQTARFITTKIYRFFVHDQADEKRISWLSERFLKNNYEIRKLLEDIFTADWFYADEYIGAKIKSPIELLVGIRRMLPLDFEQDQVQLLYQRLLGQVLFYPPNVAGWPGGKNWIDSSSLMYRLRLPRILHDDDNFNARPKDDDDVMMGQADSGIINKEQKIRNKKVMTNARGLVNVDIDWTLYISQFKQVPKENLPVSIAVVLCTKGTINFDLIHNYAEKDSREDYIRSVTIAIMSLPEYQMH